MVGTQGLGLPFRPLARLAQNEEPGRSGREAGGRGGLGQREMAMTSTLPKWVYICKLCSRQQLPFWRWSSDMFSGEPQINGQCSTYLKNDLRFTKVREPQSPRWSPKARC